MQYPKKPGIYLLINKINNKVYPGKAVNLYKRIHSHKHEASLNYKGKNGNQPIVRALKKYGWYNFEVRILEIVDKTMPNKELLFRESLWIKFYRATDKNKGYNLCEESNDNTGIRRSKEFKEKLRIANTGKNNPHYGKHLSEEHKKNLSIALLEAFADENYIHPFKGRKLSEEHKAILFKHISNPTPETRKKMREAAKFKTYSWVKKKIKQIDKITGEVIKIWDSAKEAIRSFGKPEGSACIWHVLKGNTKTAYGFKWEYFNE